MPINSNRLLLLWKGVVITFSNLFVVMRNKKRFSMSAKIQGNFSNPILASIFIHFFSFTSIQSHNNREKLGLNGRRKKRKIIIDCNTQICITKSLETSRRRRKERREILEKNVFPLHYSLFSK